MTHHDVQTILNELWDQIDLKTVPAAYYRLMRDFPKELYRWPPEESLEDFLSFNVREFRKARRAVHRQLGEDLPPHYFVFGRRGDKLWLMDVRSDDPPVQVLSNGVIQEAAANLVEFVEQVKTRHKEAWAKTRRSAEAGGKAIDPEVLIAEGRRMARPAVLLVDHDHEEAGEYAGIAWEKRGVVPPPEGTWEHVLSFDARFLPRNPRGLRGVVSVYLCLDVGDRFHQVAVTNDPNAKLPGGTADRHRLLARPFQCIPPVDALFKFGSKPIQDWLAANGAGPHTDARKFADPAPFETYRRLESAEHPYFTHEGFAMLGGWSYCFAFCYGIDESYPWDVFDKSLLALTIGNAEPFIEVFDDGKEYVTFARVT